MKVVLRILAGIVGLVVVALLAVFVYGRFSDGPVGFFSGGPLESGPIVEAPVADWHFAKDVRTIEFQLVEPPRSRTTWIVVDGQQAYIPCGVPNFRLWKKWPHEAMQDGRAVLRIEGKRYPVQLTRVDDRGRVEALTKIVGDKYDVGLPGEGPDTVWFFEITSRAAG
jgi:hypothetical protein